ncbi:hypothetical protein [Deinococcus cellulosilyticus]|uniref:hypothetical protein n=1 Tax=Deinococcus cellulosilyticus TaxID=401558 RepID=UPI0011BE9F9A|nr:hypothetical protein [Deinococcus cellulosilyticus]
MTIVADLFRFTGQSESMEKPSAVSRQQAAQKHCKTIAPADKKKSVRNTEFSHSTDEKAQGHLCLKAEG